MHFVNSAGLGSLYLLISNISVHKNFTNILQKLKFENLKMIKAQGLNVIILLFFNFQYNCN